MAISDALYVSVNIQLLLTALLVSVLWALYTRLQRLQFFRWWAWAWTASAVYLAAATVSIHLGPVWTLRKAALVLILLVSAYFQPALLVFGGMSWKTPEKPSARQVWLGMTFISAVALACFGLGFAFRNLPLISFAVRNIPRAFLLAAALFFCCIVFWRHFRHNRSYAAAITGIFCFSYGLDQALYFLRFSEILAVRWNIPFPLLLHNLAGFEVFASTRLPFLDLVDTCGISLGMIVLFIERHERTLSALQVSEQQRFGLVVDNVSLQLEIQNRRAAEEGLRRSEEFSRRVILNSPVAMVVSRSSRETIELINDKFTDLFGYDLNDMKEVSDWWPLAYPDPEYRQSARTEWQKLIDQANQGSTQPLSMEARVCCKNGSFRDVEFHLSLVNDLYMVSFVDLTERNKALKDLQESESRYRDLVENSEDLLGTHDLDGRILSINGAPCRRLGYTVEEVLQMNIRDLLSPRFRHLYPEFVHRVLENGHARGITMVVTRKGEERVWEYFATLRKEGVSVPVIRGMGHDVTERFRAEQDLKEHAMYMDALISNIPLGIVIKDEKQLVRFCNPAFERMFQYKESEIQAKDLDELIAPHDLEEAALLTSAVQSGGVVHTTARRRRKDGVLIDVELYGVKVLSGNSFVGAFAIYQDITERKKSEEKLVVLRNRLTRAQEEERARIARDLHDDAGQRLALLSIDLEQLKQSSMKLKSSLTAQLESLVKAASEITSDVHNVSRRLHPSQVELLGLPEALSNFCRDFAARNAMEIELESTGLRQKLPQDAALCLFRVAQEAVRNVQKHSGSTRALIQLDEISGSLRLRVSDQGAGFDPQSADPVHGLGLLSMQERLHSLGGELFIHSRPGGGTCVEACIPLSPAVPA